MQAAPPRTEFMAQKTGRSGAGSYSQIALSAFAVAGRPELLPQIIFLYRMLTLCADEPALEFLINDNTGPHLSEMPVNAFRRAM